MDIQNDTSATQGDSNIPTSLDITELLSKLDSVQSTPVASGRRRNIRLIELDPHHHEHEQTHIKTRLFVAAAFGPQAVVAQIFALELTKDGEEEYEWVDVSEKRIAGRDDGDNRIRPVLIYPPCCADSLPYDQKRTNDRIMVPDEIKAVEITSCALIPAPAIRIASPRAAVHDDEQDRILTQRTVAVVLGSSRGRVFSILLRVLGGISESTEQNNFAFSLVYQKCKSFDDEDMGKQLDSDTSTLKRPVMYQIFPQSKVIAEEQFMGAIQEDPDFLGEAESHVRVIHPSKSLHMNNVTGMRSISSITFGRGDWRLCRKRRKKRGQTVLMKDDSVWVIYTNGSMVKMPSWKLFISVKGNGKINHFSKKDVSEGDSAAGDPNQQLASFPVNSPFQSPLDVPPPQTNRLNPSGFINRDIDFDEQSIASKMSMTSKMSVGTSHSQFTVSCDQNYWGVLSTIIASSTQSAQSAGTQQKNQSLQGLVLGTQCVSGSSMPFAVHSSRVECSQRSRAENYDTEGANEGANMPVADDKSWASSSDDEHYGLVTGTVVEGTAALVRGALGAALGAVRWGFGGGTAVDSMELDHESFDNVDDSLDVIDSVEEDSHENDEDQFDISNNSGREDLISKKGETLDLLPWPLCSTSLLYSDVPRKFEHAVVEPSSSLVATTDNLGRVILIDLETQQPVRMWKGMRNVSLHFAELPCNHLTVGKSVRSKLYLVIHGYKRGTIEVYRLRQGPRVAAASVPDQDKCSVVESFGPPSEGSRVSCFLFEEIAGKNQSTYGSNCQQSILDYIVIDDGNQVLNETLLQRMQQITPPVRHSMQLNFLIQLLASDTNIQCNSETILQTFKSIQALSDLGEGLHAMAKSQKMEQIGSEGSSFHSQALMHCKLRLEKAVEKENKEGSGLLQKSVISDLSSKISYHEKLANAYDVLHRYEIRTEVGNEDADIDFQHSQPLSEWASEAISWISVAEEHDIFPSTTAKRREDLSKPLVFSKFAAVCSPPNPKTRGPTSHAGVYLVEVKRDRQFILMRIFRPLLEDLFVFKVVNSIFSSLGIEQDFDIQQQYFGEWVAGISSYDIAQSNLSGAWRPMFRWIQDLILFAFDVHQKNPSEFDEVQLKDVCRLQTLLDFCVRMEDLTKAFLLAVICMDAVSSASKQIEEKTYGKIAALECVQPWEIVLRKLRVLLLVTFRLSGDVNVIGTGVNPLTLKNITEFSTYYWVARDELSLSHDDQVLLALESACLSSSVAFYPSSSDGDDEDNKNIILQSCSYSNKNSITNPNGLTNDTNSRPLLFYMRDHAKCPTHLAAHRALILGRLWGQTPSNIKLLNNAVATLHLLLDTYCEFNLPVMIEFYQSWIRSTCHSMIFGFLDGHGGSKETMSPLMADETWRHNFLNAAKKVLSLIVKCANKHEDLANFPATKAVTTEEIKFSIAEMWPPLQDDPYLVALTGKFRGVIMSSVELHLTMLFAYELTGDISCLESVSQSVSDLFTPLALYLEMGPTPDSSPQRYQLLDTMLLAHVKKNTDPIVSRFDLDDVEVVGKSMGIDATYVRTRFFIESYRFSKDSSVEDLLTTSIAYLDKQLFLNEMIHIICQRLHCTITSLKKTKNYRGVISLFDANTCRWIEEEAVKEPSMLKDQAPLSLIATQALVVRCRSMSKSISDEIIEDKILAISAMSGDLLKAVQSKEKQGIKEL